MSKVVEKRSYPTQYLNEYQNAKQNLIRMPRASLRKGAAPVSFAKGALPTSDVCFLAETDRIQAGCAYSVFEVNRVCLDEKTHRLDVDADISFPGLCEEISLYADLLDMERDCVLASFEQETVKASNRLEYQIDESFDGLPEGKLGVILCASWKAVGSEVQKAAIIRQIGSDVTYGIDFTYPRKEPGYIKFTDSGKSAEGLAPKIPGLFLPTEGENIQIALFREPQDGKDLDYLCEFGKDGAGQPYLGVPTLFTVWLDSATTSFCTDKPVNVTLAIASLDPSVGGRYVVATGSSRRISEDMTVKAKEKEIEVEFVGPWKTPFPYEGCVRPYDFSYEVILELYTVTAGEEPVLQPPLIAVSSLRREGECLQKIPDVSIRWGCLKEGTRIRMADGSLKAIEKIEIGDRIKDMEGSYQVGNVWKGLDEVCIRLMTADGKVLFASKDHPVLTTDGWKRAGEIQKDTALVTEDGETAVKETEEVKGDVAVYNLSLEGKPGNHSMIAGGIVVGDFERQNQP